MDTYPDALEEKLGFDVIRARLEGKVNTPMGQERLDGMQPARTLDWLRTELTRVEELQGAFQYGDAVPLSNLYDLRDVLRRAAPEDAFVDPADLKAVRLTIITLRRLKTYFENRDRDYPMLANAVARITPLPGLEDHIESIIDEDASIRDDASPELHRLRQQIRAKQSQLRDTLDEALRNAINQGYATEDQATIRGGRMVIPVRAEAKGKVEGFVHDTSASGQTVYIEPAACLELNNEVRELKSAEQNEIERILRAVTTHIRRETEAMEANLKAVGQFDLPEPDPREQPLHEAVLFRQVVEGINGPAVEQSEIADVPRYRHFAQSIEHPVEGIRGRPAQAGLAFAVSPTHVDHVTAFAPALDHARDQFGGILQIGVDDHDGVSPRIAQARAHRTLLAEIAAQTDEADAGGIPAKTLDQFAGPVATAVIDI